MKTMILNTFVNTSKAILLSTILLTGVLWLTSCDSDDVDNLYTFTDKMMGEYLLSDTTYSEFYKIIEKTKDYLIIEINVWDNQDVQTFIKKFDGKCLRLN